MSLHRIPIAAVALTLCVVPARASIVITIEQVGNNVVASGSGTVNLTDLTFVSQAGAVEAIIPVPAFIGMGTTITTPTTRLDAYQGLTGPATFGTADTTGTPVTSGSGDLFAFNASWDAPPSRPTLFVPHGYTSGTELSAADTYAGQTFASMGLTPGTYTWNWGTGANADSFKVQIVPATAIPEPSTAILAVFQAVALVTTVGPATAGISGGRQPPSHPCGPRDLAH
jgi:hypothetical protein